MCRVRCKEIKDLNVNEVWRTSESVFNWHWTDKGESNIRQEGVGMIWCKNFVLDTKTKL